MVIVFSVSLRRMQEARRLPGIVGAFTRTPGRQASGVGGKPPAPGHPRPGVQLNTTTIAPRTLPASPRPSSPHPLGPSPDRRLRLLLRTCGAEVLGEEGLDVRHLPVGSRIVSAAGIGVDR